MGEEPEVAVTVHEIMGSGSCPLGLKKGDSFTMGYVTPAGFCSWALNAILPLIAVVRFGGRLPWEKEEGEAYGCCPDPENPVVFRITKTRPSD